MSPSFRAFTEELFLIKAAEEAKPVTGAPRPDIAKMFRQMLVNSLTYGAGFGIGSGTGWLMAEKLLPRTFAGLSDRSRAAIGAGTGVLAGLGSLAAGDAMKRARQKEDEVAAVRDHQGP